MTQTKLIGPFSQVLTLGQLSLKGPLSDDQLEIRENAGILVANGRILEVDTFNELHEKANEIEEQKEPMTLIPGLIDCHTHMVWGGNRSRDYALRMRGASYEEILNQGGGIFETVEHTRRADHEELLAGFEKRLQRHLSRGVTTVEVKSGYGLDLENEIKMLEVAQSGADKFPIDLITTCLAAHVCPKEFPDKAKYLEFLIKEVLPVIKERDLASRVDAFVEPSAFPVEVAESYLTQAKAMGFDLTIHADQFTTGGTELAAMLGALSADHLEASRDEEIEILSKSDVIPVALPGASLGLGMQFTPSRKLLNAGCSLAIATDWNPGSGPMGDLMTQAALLGVYEKLSTAEVLAGITFRAAAALGLRDRGQLREGQLADFVAFPTADYRDILYHQGQMTPSAVWKGGKSVDL